MLFLIRQLLCVEVKRMLTLFKSHHKSTVANILKTLKTRTSCVLDTWENANNATSS